MKRIQRTVLLALLTREMRKRGSWCGETHIQKAAFFLQDLVRVDADFEFILYRHGPFSFELRDELSSMQADDLLGVAVRREGYGPSFYLTPFSEEFLERYPKTTSRYANQVQFVADIVGDKGVAELERLATALFISTREGIEDVNERAERLVELKPHISRHEARSASQEIEYLFEKWRQFDDLN